MYHTIKMKMIIEHFVEATNREVKTKPPAIILKVKHLYKFQYNINIEKQVFINSVKKDFSA